MLKTFGQDNRSEGTTSGSTNNQPHPPPLGERPFSIVDLDKLPRVTQIGPKTRNVSRRRYRDGLLGRDKSQDEVESTLELVRNTGIEIWMLTGDKIETATYVAIPTKLVARNRYIHQVAKRERFHFRNWVEADTLTWLNSQELDEARD